ncbi:metallophosphoesterase, partial [Yangia mangrovi]
MADFRFIHASDLHLGRRFAAMPEEIRPHLAEARHGAIPRLAGAARAAGAAHVLIAGDLFDTPTPSPRVLVQALNAFGAEDDLTWWVLPGNHDSLGAEALWAEVTTRAPANLRLLDTPEPVEMAPGAWLLPAPLPRKFPGYDLTDWMPAAETPDGALRIGLAHGAVRSFDEEDARASEVIPPDRAESARLDYLALGDWHGQMALGPRTRYSGTPERDGFRHEGRGACLAVTLSGPGEMPRIETIETGLYHWQDAALPLLPGQDAAQALHDALPEGRA